jgi:hypothetical protein
MKVISIDNILISPYMVDKINAVSYELKKLLSLFIFIYLSANAAVERCPGGASVSNSWFSRSGAEGRSSRSTAAFSTERSGVENDQNNPLGHQPLQKITEAIPSRVDFFVMARSSFLVL